MQAKETPQYVLVRLLHSMLVNVVFILPPLQQLLLHLFTLHPLLQLLQ